MASRGINKVILVGNVGQDPETRYMPNGGAVTNLSLATSETWKDKNTGEQQERTEWHRVTFYQRLAEIVAEYVKKGSKLYVEGRLQTRSWEQDGIKRYATDIIANDMQMLDSRGGDGSSWQGGNAPQQRSSGGGGGYGNSGQGNSGYGNSGQGNSGQGSGANSRSQPAPPPEMDNNFDDDIPF